MPVDPATAFALAGNIIQFIDFSSNLLSESLAIYRSVTGTTTKNIELSIVIKDVQHCIAPLRQAAKSSSSASNYRELLEACDKVANELLSAVERLSVKDGPNRKW